MLHTVVIDLLYAAGLVRGVGGFLSRWLDSLSVYHALPHRSVYHSPTPAVEFFLPANSRFIRSVRSHQKAAAFCSNHVGQSEVFCGQFCSVVRRNTGLPNRFTLFMAKKNTSMTSVIHTEWSWRCFSMIHTTQGQSRGIPTDTSAKQKYRPIGSPFVVLTGKTAPLTRDGCERLHPHRG